ncbi:MAG: hypothetical protein ACKO2B_01010, partial [Betaproteobacteria bacterium]
ANLASVLSALPLLATAADDLEIDTRTTRCVDRGSSLRGSTMGGASINFKVVSCRCQQWQH